MSVASVRQETLAASLWPVVQAHGGRTRVLRGVALALLGTAAMTVAAKIQVPFYPVPMTMQTMVVLVLGMAYGWRLAGATMLLYLLEGALGLPVFVGTPAKGIGIAYIMGSTGGYLLGFVFAAIVCGWLAERGWDRSVWRTVLALLIGNALIYVPGLLWLGALFGWDKPILSWGLYPFVLGDLTKLAMAAALMPLAWQLSRRIGRARD